MRLRWAMAIIVLAPSLASCTDSDGGVERDAGTTTRPPLYQSAFEPGECPMEVEAPARVTCGTVTVPERHADPDGPTIEMAVALIEPDEAARGGDEPASDPLVLLPGGPGDGFVAALPSLLDDPIVEDRAMVLVDPRGTGFSEPFLGCSELDELEVPLLALDADDPAARQLQHDAVDACRERLTGDGVDLAAYSYAEIAADIAVLRHALGYDQWNLYGISNGGRIALEVLRRHPKGVRSVVLDAALPPQGNLIGELWPHAQRAFDALYEGCAADPTCDGAHPDLGATAASLIERLADDPVVAEVEDTASGDRIDVRIDDEVALGALRNAMYDTGLIPLLPRYIGLLAEGEGVADVAGLIAGERGQPGTFSHGMSLSVNCQEEVAFLDDAFFEQQAAELPALASVIEDPTVLDDCAVWDVGQADPSIEEAVASDTPALVLVGAYDPVHPRASSETIVGTLSRAQLFELPGLGHGTVRVHDCPRAMVHSFLVAPGTAVDDSCIEDMPEPAWLP